jgi:hypothetical protein
LATVYLVIGGESKEFVSVKEAEQSDGVLRDSKRTERAAQAYFTHRRRICGKIGKGY